MRLTAWVLPTKIRFSGHQAFGCEERREGGMIVTSRAEIARAASLGGIGEPWVEEILE